MIQWEKKKLFLLDMDGTIYLDQDLFPCTMPFLEKIREKGGRYLFLTNNSSRSVDAYMEKLGRMGIKTTAEDFLTSVNATAAALKKEKPYKNIYVFGTRSLQQQLRQEGFAVTDTLSDEVDCLLCGFDTELNFQKLEDACILLGRGVDFYATNPDWVCPTWYGFVPDCGSVCEMLFRATGRRPRVIGKPRPEMALLAMEKFGYAPEETVMIGDRIYTDVACGLNAGIDSVLVLSGECSREDAEESEEKPTEIRQDLGEIYPLLG